MQDRLEGDAIFLRPLGLDDVTANYLRWLNDPEVSRFLETRHRPQSMQTIREFVERVNARDDEFLFGIFLKKDGRHIGNIKIGPVKADHSLADVSLLIGERDCWGQGIATDAIRAISRFALSDDATSQADCIDVCGEYRQHRAPICAPVIPRKAFAASITFSMANRPTSSSSACAPTT